MSGERPTRGHALYVAWGFPPAKSGGVFRMMETANVLHEQGWHVTVAACDIDDLRRYAGVDLSTLAGVESGIDVVRVPMELGPFETDLHRWDEKRVLDPAGWMRDYQARVDAGFPNSIYALWAPPLLDAVRKVHARRPVDLVVASGGPFVCFATGHLLRKEHGVPYVLDYRDSWSLQQFTNERLHPEGSPVERTESDLLRGASDVWFVNHAMRVWHEETYPQIIGKTRVVTNGYDESALIGLPRPAPPHAHVRFGYLGTVTAAVPLRECLDGYVLARQRDATVSASTLEFFGYLGFYPTPHPALNAEILRVGDHGVTYRGALPKTDVGMAYADMDALVLTFGGTRYVTSGKVFEYMATGRPIVSIHDPQNAVRDVLEGYPLWFQAASLGADDVADAFIAAAAAVSSGRASDPAVIEACLAHAAQFERRACLRPAVTELPAIVESVRSTYLPRGSDCELTAVPAGWTDAEVRELIARSGRRLVEVPVADSPHFDGADDVSAAPDGWLAQRAAAVGLAEPGTLAGRLRRLYEVVAATPSGAMPSFQDVHRAEMLIASGAGVFWSIDAADHFPLRWSLQAIPESIACLDLRGTQSSTSEPSEDVERLIVLGSEAGSDEVLSAVRTMLGRRPPPRVRRPQPPPASVPDDRERAPAVDSPADTDQGQHVVLSSRPVGAGSSAVLLARSIAERTAHSFPAPPPPVVLSRTGSRGPLKPGQRRVDVEVQGIRIIRLPIPAIGDGSSRRSWRRRPGSWRDRRVTVQAPLPVRVSHVNRSKRLRARRERDASPLNRALVASTRAVSAGFRVLDLADRRIELAGRHFSDVLDRVDGARGRGRDWKDLYPRSRDLVPVFLPVLERLQWDTLHVVDAGMVDVARAAVAQRRAEGRPAQWLLHTPEAATVSYAEQHAMTEILVSDGTREGVTLPAPVALEASERPQEVPWSRAGLRSLVGLGAYNMAGQAWSWAKALERAVPGVATEVVMIDRGSHLRYRCDRRVPAETFLQDEGWSDEFQSHVLDTWTHALIEGGRSLLGGRYGRTYINDATVLSEAGISVGLLFHGSDLRDPRLHALRTPWSPFSDPDDELVRTLQSRRDVLYEHYLAFEGPKWVSTPDLLADLPGATWLPVVVDGSEWRSSRPPMERRTPLVIHAPSRARMKGTEAIESALAPLVRDRVIEYHRIEGVPPEQMPAIVGDADLVLDQFALGSYGVGAVEAMAAGRVVVGHITEEVRELCPMPLPVIEATPATIDTVIRSLVSDRDRARECAIAGERYASEFHDGRLSGRLLASGLRVRGAGSPRGRLGPIR